MKPTHLTPKFFRRPAVVVAQKLLGKVLVHHLREKKLTGKIVETEAYVGVQDRASHGYGGKLTPRNKAEFLKGGHIYIYLCYGMYWQFNITTGEEGIPECVLIRAVEPLEGIEIMKKLRKTDDLFNLTNGPGKFCQAFGFDKSYYGLDLIKSKEVYLTAGEEIRPNQIVRAKRIGIDYAGTWKNKLLRFYLKDNPFVSGK